MSFVNKKPRRSDGGDGLLPGEGRRRRGVGQGQGADEDDQYEEEGDDVDDYLDDSIEHPGYGKAKNNKKLKFLGAETWRPSEAMDEALDLID